MRTREIILIAAMAWTGPVWAQSADGIGIGTTDVHENAILEVESSGKGILIPRLTSGQREAIAPAGGAEGLMVYDTDVQAFYYWNGSQWNRMVEESYPMNLSGNGPVPQGGIIMWSGATPPDGWTLGDGTNDTPDLSGRFIVGYQTGHADYGTLGDTGGEEGVTLTAGQSGLRTHNHTASATGGAHTHTISGAVHTGAQPITFRSGSSDGSAIGSPVNNQGNSVTVNSPGSNHSHTVTVNNVTEDSAQEAHENRPPYYVLAFIMKL